MKLIMVTKLYTGGGKWGLLISVDMYNLEDEKGTGLSKVLQREEMKLDLLNNGNNSSLGSKPG